MVIYILFFIVITIFAFTDVFIKTKDFVMISKRFNTRLFLYLLFLFFIIMMGSIRWNIGSDWNSYLSDFINIQNYNFKQAFDSYSGYYGNGYILVTYVISHLFNSYNMYLFICLSVIIALTYSTYYKYSKYPLVTCLASYSFVFCYAFAVPRHGIALAIIVFSYRFIVDKKLIKFLVCILLAISFHNTAIFFLPAFWIYQYKLRLNKLIVLLSIAGLLGLIFPYCIQFIIKLNIMPSSIQSRLMTYVTFGSGAEIISFGFDIIIRILTRGFVIALIFIFLYKKKEEDNQIRGMINLYLFGIFIYLIAFNLDAVFLRIATFYEDVTQYYIFAAVLAHNKKISNKCIIFTILLAYFGLKFASRLFLGYSETYIPYKIFFG